MSEEQKHVMERPFSFLRINERPPKPRNQGLTEVRGPYYTPMGRRYLQDMLETMGAYIDSVKFAGGSFALMPREIVRELIEVCHDFGVQVSTGGFIEYVLTQGSEAVNSYIEECKELGFDIMEISSGFLSIPPDDLLRLVEKVQKVGLQAKAEVGVLFGAGGNTPVEEVDGEGLRNPEWVVTLAKRLLNAGARMILLESEGITENVKEWRVELPALFVNELGLKNLMFEAAAPEVFSWYVKNFGPQVNLFVDHSQVVQLECLRAGIWGTRGMWGRVVTYQDK